MDGLRNTVPDSSSPAGSQFHYLASSLARLLETARRELEGDREAVKASLATAFTILQSGSASFRALTAPSRARWQAGRSRACELSSKGAPHDHTRDLSAVAQQVGPLFSFVQASLREPRMRTWSGRLEGPVI